MHEHEPESTGHNRSHILMMLAGCLIPIVLIIVVVSADIESPYIPFLLILLCPLSMLLMHLPRMLPRKKESQREPSTKLMPEIGMRENV